MFQCAHVPQTPIVFAVSFPDDERTESRFLINQNDKIFLDYFSPLNIIQRAVFYNHWHLCRLLRCFCYLSCTIFTDPGEWAELSKWYCIGVTKASYWSKNINDCFIWLNNSKHENWLLEFTKQYMYLVDNLCLQLECEHLNYSDWRHDFCFE